MIVVLFAAFAGVPPRQTREYWGIVIPGDVVAVEQWDIEAHAGLVDQWQSKAARTCYKG